MRAWLDLKMVTGRYSAGLVDQMVYLVENRELNTFAILDEIGHLEGAPQSRPTRTKAAAPYKGPVLAGLWHKHFFNARFLVKNVMNHWTEDSLLALIESILADDAIPDEAKAGAIAHQVVKGGFEDRAAAGKMTGEWIIYVPRDKRNYYLTLAGHAEADEAILQRVHACQGEFPDIGLDKIRRRSQP